MAARVRKESAPPRTRRPPEKDHLREIWEGSEHALWLVESLPDGGFRMLAMNPRGREALGVPPGCPPGEIASHLPPGLVEEMGRLLRQAVREGSVSFDFAFPRGGKETQWLVSLRAVGGGRRQSRRVVGSAVEVSAQREMEQTISFLGEDLSRLAGEEYLKGLLRFLAARAGLDGAFLVRMGGGGMASELIHLPPEGWEATLPHPLAGSAAEAIVGERRVVLLGGARARFPADGLLGRLAAEGLAGILLPDGEGRPLGVLAATSRTPFPAKVSRRLPLLLDLLAERAAGVMERRRILNQLEEREAFFRGVFERATLGMGVADLKGRVLEVNPAYCRMMGYPAEEIRRMGFDTLTHPDDRENYSEMVRRLGRGEIHFITLEKRYLHSSGRIIHGRLSLSLIRDPEGNPWRMVGVMSDFTDIRAWQAEVERSRRKLRELADRREKEMEAERSAIARELHDQVGQDLTALKMQAACLRNQEPDGAIAAGLQEMTALLDGCLGTVRRIARSLRPDILERLGLEAAVEWLLADFTNRTDVAHGLVIQPRPLGLDRERSAALFRILQEALSNVTRHAFAHRVEVRLTLGREEALLEVRDDGEGIPSARTGGFMTLGILGMQERALSLGGSVAVEPGVGGGTVVRATLPLGGG